MDYKETEKILALASHPEWVEAIERLKELECDNKKYTYNIFYRQGKQRNPRHYWFNKVDHVEGTETFTFIAFKRDFYGNLTEETGDMIVLRRSDIINLEVKEKYDWSKINSCVSEVDF